MTPKVSIFELSLGVSEQVQIELSLQRELDLARLVTSEMRYFRHFVQRSYFGSLPDPLLLDFHPFWKPIGSLGD